MVAEGFGQLVAPGDAELLIGALEVAFDGTDREVHVTGDLLVGATGRGLHGGVELAGSQTYPCTHRLDWGRDGAFAAGQQSRGFLLGGGRLPGHAGAAEHDGGFGVCFGGVEVGAEVLELAGDLVERGAVCGRDGVGVSGASRRQITVDLVDQSGQAGGHLSGAAEAGQAVQGAAGPDQVADLFAELGRRFQVVPRGRKVTGGCRGPGPGLKDVGLVRQH